MMMTAQLQLKQQAYASNLKSRALSILVYLIDRSNKELTCFPAISTMAEQLHISISTVKRALHELVNCGFIKKDPRFREKNHGQTSNLYTLVVKEDVTEVTITTPEVTSNPTQEIATTEKEAPAKQKPCAVTYISFDDISRQSSEQASETQSDATPVHEVKQTNKPSKVAQIKKKMPRNIPVHTPFLLLQCCHRIGETSPIREFFSTNLHWLKHFLNKWTGAGVNLLPP